MIPQGFLLWDGQYDKAHYEVILKDGRRDVCWPNSGQMHGVLGSHGVFDVLAIRKLRLKEALQYLNRQGLHTIESRFIWIKGK